MKKSSAKVTLNTLDKKIDGLGASFDKKIDGLGASFDKKIDGLGGTVDVLAISTKRGFDKADTFQEEMTEFAKRTALTLFNVDSKLQTVDQRLDAIEKTLGPVVHLPQIMQREFREHERRIALLEKKMGLTK